MPKLSIIFGTYNRLHALQQSVESVRKSVGSLSYEICVCDGGSTDGSREWLSVQPDVVLVGKRTLDGAVDAFNHAYQVAQGDYIVNFNDDALLLNDALQQAYAFMQKPASADVGQCAFTLNFANGTWGVQTAVGEYVYANFGVVRREVAEAVVRIQGGFWAPVYRTYGADCEFSLWVWKLGWRVVGIDARVHDVPVQDTLRERNHGERAITDQATYVQRWQRDPRVVGPDAVRVPQVGEITLERYRMERLRQVVNAAGPRPDVADDALPQISPWTALHACDPGQDQLPSRGEYIEPGERVLHIKIETDDDPQTCQEQALRTLATDGYEKYSWLHRKAALHLNDLQSEIVKTAQTFKPTLIFAQLQSPDVILPETLRRIRGSVRNHRLVIATWCGDVSRPNSIRTDDLPWQQRLYSNADLVLFTSLDQVRNLRKAGVQQAAYLQIGYDTDRYFTQHTQEGMTNDIPFIANVHTHVDCGTDEQGQSTRVEAVRACLAAGLPVRCYGGGWQQHLLEGDSLPQRLSGEVLRKAYRVLNISNANTLERYSSDRLFRSLACGPAVFTKRFPGMEGLGLTHQDTCMIWETPDQLVEQLKSTSLEECWKIGRRGAALARTHHTWHTRMLELQPLIKAVRKAKRVDK